MGVLRVEVKKKKRCPKSLVRQGFKSFFKWHPVNDIRGVVLYDY